MIGRATRLAIFGLCVWFGYKVALFVTLVQSRSEQCSYPPARAALVTFVKSLTVTETQTITLASLVTTTAHSTITLGVPSMTSEQDRLSHVVIPMAMNPAQLGRLRRTFKHWNANPPCVERSWPNRPHESSVTLSILLYGARTETAERQIQSMYWSLNSAARSCFAELQILGADLPAHTDKHVAGSQAMFETLLNNTLDIKDMQYVFWMEPDTVPIRADWLNALDRACRTGERFWIKGSALRHDLRRDIITQRYGSHFLYHINGNALYNLRPNEYPAFYRNQLIPYLEATNARHSAFDLAPARFLLAPENEGVWRENAHRFQYTEIIQNRWGENYLPFERAQRFPGTFLIHGGIPEDP